MRCCAGRAAAAHAKPAAAGQTGSEQAPQQRGKDQQQQGPVTGKKRKVPGALDLINMEALKFGRVELNGGT